MSTPFGSDDQGRHEDVQRREDGRDDSALRISEDEQGVDALLRAGGEQWRAAIPAVEFDAPSSRVLLLSRRARIATTIGIAAAVVAIVLTGSAIIGRGGSSTSPPVASVPDSTSGPVLDSSAPAPTSFLTPLEALADVVGERPGWPTSGLIAASPALGGGVRVAWQVGTAELLVGVPETAFCNGEQLRLRLVGPATLQVDLLGGSDTDAGCDSSGLRVTAFTPPTAMDRSVTTRVTSSQSPGRSTTLPPLGGIDLPDSGKYVDLPSVSTARTSGSSAGVSVQWQPVGGRLLVTAPYGSGCRADVGWVRDTRDAVQVEVRPNSADCSAPVGSMTHAVQLPPHPPGYGFDVTVVNNTTDAALTTDVFRVPATLLENVSDEGVPWSTSEPVGAPGSELGRTADGRLFFRYVGGVCVGYNDDGTVQTGDQRVLVRWQETTSTEGCPGVGVMRTRVVRLLTSTDPNKALTVDIHGRTEVLPPVQ